MAGRMTLTGGTATTGADGAVACVCGPPAFVAVTTARSVLPTSADVRLYVGSVAPETSAQLAPTRSQRRHWYVKVIGVVPVQLPRSATSVWPSRAVPEIDGGRVLAGGTAATVPV